jgi:CSLREA domain-containing protein
MQNRLAFAFVVAALLAAVVPGMAHAATIVVNSSADDLTPGADHCTLRDAIEDAVFDDSTYGDCLSGSGNDTIVFQLPARSTITLALGELLLPAAATSDEAIDIQGPGADELTISGAGAGRIFKIGHSSVATPEAISGLTIVAGKVETGEESLGGGVLNEGELALSGVVVEGNEVKATGSLDAMGSGGGIANLAGATLAIERSTIVGNTAGAVATAPGLAYGDGGAVFNQGALTISGSTIADNGAIAVGGAGQSAGGGGIATTTTGTRVTGSTIVGNAVISGALKSGANVLAAGTTEVEGTIVAEPEGGTNCAGVAGPLGFDLEDEDSCGFDQPTDQSNTDPKLAAAGLADNGGPTPTIALEADSPALDQGLAAAGETTDQRGLPRPVVLAGLTAPPGGDHADIGAFEQQAPETEETTEPGGGGSPGGGGGGGSSGGGGGTSPPGGGPSPIHTVAPTLKVTIAHLPAKTTRRRVTIRFHANLSGAKFRCSLDGSRSRPCRSPFKAKRLGLGRHTFIVSATAAGQHSKAAKVSFRVVRPGPRH